MKNSVRHPASRELFYLVRKVADVLFREAPLSDAALGRMLGLEGARTSRWKHGAIAVDDATRLLALSQGLSIDLSLLVHVASGEMNAQDAWKIHTSAHAFLRFLSDQLILPEDDHAVTLLDSQGDEARVVRNTVTQYTRHCRRGGNVKPLSQKEKERVVMLADDDVTTQELFSNMTRQRVGVRGIVVNNLADALLQAGQETPHMIIMDIFLCGADGFSAMRSLSRDRSRFFARLIALCTGLTPELTKRIRGCGAEQSIEKPLRARVMGRLLRELTIG